MVSTRSRRGVPLPPPRPRRSRSYKPDDDCKRHRLPDNKPKTVEVSVHTRRKPKK
jgi:hypothetical protein